MKKLTMLILACSFAFSNLVEGGPLKRLLGMEYDFSESMLIDFSQDQDKDKWKQAYSQETRDGRSIIEWIPKDQTLKNRTEMVTMQFFAHTAGAYRAQSAIQWVNDMMNSQHMNYPGLQWNMIHQTENDVLYEWSLPNGYQGHPPQHELVRIVWTNQGIHRLAYEKRVAELDPQSRELWFRRLSTARLIRR